MVPHTFPPPQLKSRHGTFLGSIWDVLLLTQAQLLHCSLLLQAFTVCASACLAAPGLGVCGHCQAGCSHTKLALAEGSLPAREMGAVALGRHRAPGVTHPCRQCWESWAVSLQVSPISAALQCQCNSLSTANPFLFNVQKTFPICSNLGCEFPYSCQHLLCRNSCHASVHLLGFWVIHVIWEILNTWGNSYEETSVMGTSREMGGCRTANSDN